MTPVRLKWTTRSLYSGSNLFHVIREPLVGISFLSDDGDENHGAKPSAKAGSNGDVQAEEDDGFLIDTEGYSGGEEENPAFSTRQERFVGATSHGNPPLNVPALATGQTFLFRMASLGGKE